MPGRMGGELRHPGDDRDAPHHFRPRPQAQWFGVVAAGFRQEQRSPSPADRRPMRQILRQHRPGRRRVRHHPLMSVFRCLRSYSQHPPARIQLVGPQRAQLFPPQCRIIGQSEHYPVPRRLGRRHGQDVAPLLFGRDPRQFHQPRHQAALLATPLPSGRIPAASNRIGLPDTFLDQEVEEQPRRHQPLLDRRVRQPAPGIDRHHVRAAATGSPGQLTNEHRNISTVRSDRVDAAVLADLQELHQPARIRIDRPRSTPQISPHPKPDTCQLVPPQHRPLVCDLHQPAQRHTTAPTERPKPEDHPGA